MADKVILMFHLFYKHVGETHGNYWGVLGGELVPFACLACGKTRWDLTEFANRCPLIPGHNRYLCDSCNLKEAALQTELMPYEIGNDDSLIKLARKPIYDEIDRIKDSLSTEIKKSGTGNKWVFCG